MGAFLAQRAVDWTFHLSAFGTTLSYSVRSGSKDGTESYVLTSGGQVARASLVLDGKLYFEGNTKALNEAFNFKAGPAKSEANKWIAVPKSSADFADLSNGLTVSSAVDRLLIGGTLTMLPPTVVDGENVLAVHEVTQSQGVAVSETVYVRASAPRLPVKIALEAEGLPATIAYGPWDRPPTVKVPKKAVAFKSSWISKS
jgi:hypothetical protein